MNMGHIELKPTKDNKLDTLYAQVKPLWKKLISGRLSEEEESYLRKVEMAIENEQNAIRADTDEFGQALGGAFGRGYEESHMHLYQKHNMEFSRLLNIALASYDSQRQCFVLRDGKDSFISKQDQRLALEVAVNRYRLGEREEQTL